jgi:hypothetical protein
MSRIELKVLGFDKYNKRSDIKHPYWFAMSNRFFEDPDFDDFTSDEKLVWIFILAQASSTKKATVEIVYAAFYRKTGIDPRALITASDKLENKKIISILARDSFVSRTESERDPNGIRTLHYTTEHNTTEQNRTISTQNAPAFVSEPKKKRAKNPNPEQTEKRIAIREAFKSAYREEFGQEYAAGFSAKEYRLIDNWLKNVSLEQALEYCRIWPKWNDPRVVEGAHSFYLLTVKYLELDAWFKRAPQLLEKIATGRATKAAHLTKLQRIAGVNAHDAIREESNKTNLNRSGGAISFQSQRRVSSESFEPDPFKEPEPLPNETDHAEGY